MNKTITILIFLLTTSLLRKCSCLPLKFTPDYKEALKLSLLYLEAQRSGRLPSNNRIKWRGDSALDDRGLKGEDLTGGYYDASDYVKFSFNLAFTTTVLSWGVIAYGDAYIEAGQYSEVLDAIKWSTDYLIKCHPSPNEFYGQVGEFSIDHAFWGRPEDMNLTRPAYKIDEKNPGTDLAAESAASFSSASLVFKHVDSSYSKELLRHAEQIYGFARTYRGLYKDVIPGAKQYYDSESSSYFDELAWGAVWLYKATGAAEYLEEAKDFYGRINVTDEDTNRFYYDRKVLGIQILLAEGSNSSRYLDLVMSHCENIVDKQYRTPQGLIYISKQGTLSHAASLAFACLRVAELSTSLTDEFTQFAKQQIDYILGAYGRSYVVGYGFDYPKRPHHAASSCPERPEPCGWQQFNSTLPNPHILYGALVSGPNHNDYFDDVREEFLYTDVNVDYNAGFQSALAGLIHLQNHTTKHNDLV
uniref:cellulase n=1 Tax=Gastrophysa viridula TaxID=154015 RepID=A0A3Q8LVB4_GASVI|nr:glycoside hydrolase family 9 [Gastrophysa viridula]